MTSKKREPQDEGITLWLVENKRLKNSTWQNSPEPLNVEQK
jgi:hypothetical protein